MNRKELLKEIDRLYRIEQKYYWLLVELGKKRKDLKEAQKSFAEIYDKVVQKYISEGFENTEKLHYSFSHNHLVPLIGFRVDLHENGDFLDHMGESVCFNIEKIENHKLYVRVYHIRYIDKVRGKHLEDSNKLYEIDLSKGWDKWNVREIKEEK